MTSLVGFSSFGTHGIPGGFFVCACIHVALHACICYIRVYYIHGPVYYIHTYTHIYIHTLSYLRTHVYVHTQVLYMYACVRVCMHARTTAFILQRKSLNFFSTNTFKSSFIYRSNPTCKHSTNVFSGQNKSRKTPESIV